MTPSQALFDQLLEPDEGLRLSPYLCPAGIPSIGYGCTRYEDGTPVKLTDPAITEERAVELMRATLAPFVADLNNWVRVPLNQGQFDALCDLIYNIGPGAFRDSTLLSLLNQGKYSLAAAQFPLWCHANGSVIPGLVARRRVEQSMFTGSAN